MKSIFDKHDLKKLGLLLVKGQQSEANGKLMVLQAILLKKDKHIPRGTLIQTFEEIFEEMHYSRECVSFVMNLPAIHIKDDLNGNEISDLFKKFMRKWIVGDNNHFNYIISEYSTFLKIFNNGTFFRTSNIKAQQLMEDEFQDALFRQINCLCEKKGPLVGIELWKTASDHVRKLLVQKKQRPELVEKFKAAHAEITMNGIASSKEVYPTDPLKSYLGTMAMHYFKYGYFPADTTTKKDFNDYLTQKKIDAMKQVRSMATSFQDIGQLRTLLIQHRDRGGVNFKEAIDFLNEQILEFGLKEEVKA